MNDAGSADPRRLEAERVLYQGQLELNLNLRGGIGDAIVFSNVHPDGAPDLNILHTGMPPEAGRKWILSQWIRERPQRLR